MRHYLVVLILLSSIGGQISKAQHSSSVIYTEGELINSGTTQRPVQEMPFSHMLLNMSSYQDIKYKLSKTRQRKTAVRTLKEGNTLSFYVRDILQTDKWNSVKAECIYVSDKLAI
ncbi:hypothetical protein [Fodinibius halophilus]|uniref:Uncharacterized protein n=1 Tax=Fodinibius halophilus TaxID=1736908 RepID=A0A6M1T2L4_9BACT|nr:hypothetical protein [Fodinibius halophilus]NGP88267.1 hypothetical protein [Fodinibius halophilus]